ncbi:MlaA family lipoprotein [Xylophilus sp.]|uniref:MlaA family lipoprotein n=1 Tax=Xylophilus sp. TaxID=2653893 RepID=UPI0013B78579|nr:VacJ family lipoprotein [Xylophilus sp.]KAF1045736.1 MAG: putative phospholipid-binding lipoprotein MlaA [Xylophilus sp.]
MLLLLARSAAAVAALALVAGCATAPGGDPRDPFEPFNRDVTRFNDAVDNAVLRPVAIGYQNITPQFVRTGVNNFFGNLRDVWSLVNNVLQLRVQASGETLIRIGTNTLFGLGGLVDIASELEIDRHKTDFGLTLGRYGVPTGPYLVLPLLGPSTVRDTAALPVEWKGDVLSYVHDVPVRNSLYVLRLVDTRAGLLRAGSVLEQAALDKYSFTRDAYLQLRNASAQKADDGSLDDDPAGADAAPAAGARP